MLNGSGVGMEVDLFGFAQAQMELRGLFHTRTGSEQDMFRHLDLVRNLLLWYVRRPCLVS